MKTTTKGARIQADCGKCAGTGSYEGQSYYGRDCFACKGTGKMWTTQAEIDRNAKAALAYVEMSKLEKAIDAAAEQACEGGIDGARAFFAANRNSHAALTALVGAMFYKGWESERVSLMRYIERQPRDSWLAWGSLKEAA